MSFSRLGASLSLPGMFRKISHVPFYLLFVITLFTQGSFAAGKCEDEAKIQAQAVEEFKEEIFELGLRKADSKKYPMAASAENQLRLMSWNVENLFDTEPTQGKLDAEFLPTEGVYNGPIEELKGMTFAQIKERLCASIPERYRSSCLSRNWSPEMYAGKLAQIVATYKTVFGAKSNLPDISVFSEVESPRAALDLSNALGYTTSSEGVDFEDTSDEHYKKLKEQGWAKLESISSKGGLIMSNSPDERGIDLAIAFKPKKGKLELLESKEYFVEMPARFSPTRNILVATFLVNGKEKLTVMANHWPSQGSPTFVRKAVAERAKAIYEEYAKSTKVVLVGDFNSIQGETPHPVNEVLLGGSDLVDARQYEEDKRGKVFEAPGTYYFAPGTSWNHLDRIILDARLVRARSSLRLSEEGMSIFHPETNVYQKSIKFYRDVETAERIERATGVAIKYKNVPEDARDPRVKQAFLDDPDLDVLDVRESGPNGLYYYREDGSDELKFRGVSDHFPISVQLEW